ncbi:hypothetical protein [Methylobacterium sp. Gmos1]
MGVRAPLSMKTDIQRRILVLLDQGLSAAAAAVQIGITTAYAREIARNAGYPLQKLHLEKQAARRERARALLKQGTPAAEVATRAGIHRSRVYDLKAKMKAEAVIVPSWVPEEYHKDYVLIVEQDDEFAAAAYVRRQKQQQAA